MAEALNIVAKLAKGKVGAKYVVRLRANGGMSPIVWRGAMPAGLILDTLTGTVSGTPTTPGTYTVNIQASDSLNKTVSVPATLTIAP